MNGESFDRRRTGCGPAEHTQGIGARVALRSRVAMSRSNVRRQPHRLAWAWLVVLALVGAQALGLAHALAHGAPVSAAASTTACEAAADRDTCDGAGADSYGHARGSDTCALWFGAASAAALATDATCMSMPALAAVAPGAPVGADAPGATARAFDARGPPRV
jgi:hypothetical protein